MARAGVEAGIAALARGERRGAEKGALHDDLTLSAPPEAPALSPADLQAVRNALQRYERTRRARLPAGRAQMNLEMADLLLTLLRTADRLDVDLLDSAETLLEQRLPNVPKLVNR